MNQVILHKYFSGTASKREEELILEWVEASEENRKAFQKERMLFDIALFADNKQQTRERKNARIIPAIKWGIRIAASVLVILGAKMWIKEYQYDKLVQPQTIAVPAGQRAQIMLADGTKVWLNAKSTLSYAANFGRNDRTVELDGEAYFEVVKNADMPFYVNTEHNQVKVIGTTFNVSAYKGSNEFETTLIEGIVDIFALGNNKPITRLIKNDFFGAYGSNYKKTVLPSYDYLRWKEGLYCFDDTPFKNLLDKLEKYYNVNIAVESPTILDYQCTGKFKESDGIEHILNVIQKDHAFSYTINENKDSIVIR